MRNGCRERGGAKGAESAPPPPPTPFATPNESRPPPPPLPPPPPPRANSIEASAKPAPGACCCWRWRPGDRWLVATRASCGPLRPACAPAAAAAGMREVPLRRRKGREEKREVVWWSGPDLLGIDLSYRSVERRPEEETEETEVPDFRQGYKLEFIVFKGSFHCLFPPPLFLFDSFADF